MAEELLNGAAQNPADPQGQEHRRRIVTLFNGDYCLPTHPHGLGQLSLGQPLRLPRAANRMRRRL